MASVVFGADSRVPPRRDGDIVTPADLAIMRQQETKPDPETGAP